MTWLGFFWDIKKVKCPDCNKQVIRLNKKGQELLVEKTFGHEWFYVRGNIHVCELSVSIESDKEARK